MSKAYPLLGSLLSLLLVSVFYAGEPTTLGPEEDFEFVESLSVIEAAKQLCDMIETALTNFNAGNGMYLKDIVVHCADWQKTGSAYVAELEKTNESTAITLALRLVKALQNLVEFYNKFFYGNELQPWNYGRTLVEKISSGGLAGPANLYELSSVCWYLYWSAVKQDSTFLEGTVKVLDPHKRFFQFFKSYYKDQPPVILTSEIRVGGIPLSGIAFYGFTTMKDIIFGYGTAEKMFYLDFKRPGVTTWTSYLPWKRSTAPAPQSDKVIEIDIPRLLEAERARTTEGVETKEAFATAFASPEKERTGVPLAGSAQGLVNQAEQLCDRIETACKDLIEGNSTYLHDIVVHGDDWKKKSSAYVEELLKMGEVVLSNRCATALEMLNAFDHFFDERSYWNYGRRLVVKLLSSDSSSIEPANLFQLSCVCWYLYWSAVKQDPTFSEGTVKVLDTDEQLFRFFERFYNGQPPRSSKVRAGETPLSATSFFNFNTMQDIIFGYENEMFYLDFKRPQVKPGERASDPEPRKVVVIRIPENEIEAKKASATTLASPGEERTGVPNTDSALEQKRAWAKKIVTGWLQDRVIASSRETELTELFVDILGLPRPLSQEVEKYLGQFTTKKKPIELIVNAINQSVGRTFNPRKL